MSHRRFSALLLAGVMTLSLALAACGAKDNEPDPSPSVDPAVEATAESNRDTEPSATPDAGATTAPTGATAAPAEATKAPAAQSSAVEAVWKDIEKLELPALQDMDDELLSDWYGLDVSDLAEYVGKIPTMSVQATEFFIAKVKSGKMDTVKAGVESRVDDLVEQWSQYLPEQLELVEDARIVTNGDYILLAISEHADDAVKAFNAHTK